MSSTDEGAKPWQDEEKLRELYVEQDMSSREVAEELRCSKTPILTWLDEFGIEKDASRRDMTPAELEDEDTLRRLYVERELTTQEIASKVDCSHGTVSRWINEHEIEERPSSVGELRDKAQLREMYVGKELGLTEIADSLGCAESTVLTWLRRHGIETRARQAPAANELTDDKLMREMYLESGLAINEIAEEIGCSERSVSYWLSQHDIESRRRQAPATPSLEDVELMKRLYVDERKTQREIADELGCRGENVHYWLHKHGIEGRDGTATEATEQLRDAELLRELYIEEERSTTEIAERLACGSSTVAVWLHRHGIETRPVSPTGADSPHWTGGKSIYDGVKHALPLAWREQRRQQRERDNRTCQLCGEKRDPTEQRLDVNHLIPILCGGTNGDYNLMSMCRGCHNKTEAFVREHTPSVLVDWSDDELPEGRERWTPDTAPERVGQTELAAFGDD